VSYVSHTLEETSKTYEEMKMTVEKLCKIVSTSTFEEEIHIAPLIKQKIPKRGSVLLLSGVLQNEVSSS
jgi:hypothetical protein